MRAPRAPPVAAYRIEPFIALLLEGDKPCSDCAGDANSDGSIDLTDVEAFIGCLLG